MIIFISYAFILLCAPDNYTGLNTHYSEERNRDNNEFAQLDNLGDHEYNEVKKHCIFWVISTLHPLSKLTAHFNKHSVLAGKIYSWMNMKIYEMISQSR